MAALTRDAGSRSNAHVGPWVTEVALLWGLHFLLCSFGHRCSGSLEVFFYSLREFPWRKQGTRKGKKWFRSHKSHTNLSFPSSKWGCGNPSCLAAPSPTWKCSSKFTSPDTSPAKNLAVIAKWLKMPVSGVIVFLVRGPGTLDYSVRAERQIEFGAGWHMCTGKHLSSISRQLGSARHKEASFGAGAMGGRSCWCLYCQAKCPPHALVKQSHSHTGHYWDSRAWPLRSGMH